MIEPKLSLAGQTITQCCKQLVPDKNNAVLLNALQALIPDYPVPTFTPAQQTLENLVKDSVKNVSLGLSIDDLGEVITSAATEHDLQEKLALLLEKDNPQHNDLLAKAMFAAQVLGYVNATEKVV